MNLVGILLITFLNGIVLPKYNNKYKHIDNKYLDIKYTEEILEKELLKFKNNKTKSNHLFNIIVAIVFKKLFKANKTDIRKEKLKLYKKYSIEFPILLNNYTFMRYYTYAFLDNKNYELYDSMYKITNDRFKEYIGEDFYCFDFSHNIFLIDKTYTEIVDSYNKCQSSNAISSLKESTEIEFKVFEKKKGPFDGIKDFHKFSLK